MQRENFNSKAEQKILLCVYLLAEGVREKGNFTPSHWTQGTRSKNSFPIQRSAKPPRMPPCLWGLLSSYCTREPLPSHHVPEKQRRWHGILAKPHVKEDNLQLWLIGAFSTHPTPTSNSSSRSSSMKHQDTSMPSQHGRTEGVRVPGWVCMAPLPSGSVLHHQTYFTLMEWKHPVLWNRKYKILYFLLSSPNRVARREKRRVRSSLQQYYSRC